MDKPKVIIVGASGHSKVIIDIFEKEDQYQILGLVDGKKTLGTDILGYSVIGTEHDLAALLVQYGDFRVFIAIGDNWVRKTVRDKVIALVPGIKFASAIHPSATVGKRVKVGEGVAVMAGAIINSGSSIGDFALINTKASLDHDSQMMDYSSLAPNVTTGGNVKIGTFSALSLSATVKHGVHIGSHCVVGAASLLLTDCPDHTVMYGVPAKPVRTRQPGDPYL